MYCHDYIVTSIGVSRSKNTCRNIKTGSPAYFFGYISLGNILDSSDDSSLLMAHLALTLCAGIKLLGGGASGVGVTSPFLHVAMNEVILRCIPVHLFSLEKICVVPCGYSKIFCSLTHIDPTLQ